MTESGEVAAVTTSVSPDKGAAAAAGLGVVSAVAEVPVRPRRRDRRQPRDRFETYEVEGPGGWPVTMTRNMETGVCSVEVDGPDGEPVTVTYQPNIPGGSVTR